MAKKILFSDRYGLTQAVLERRKTMTRRIINLCENDLEFMKISDQGEYLFCSKNALDGAYPAYNVGEVVAVSQPYKDIYPNADFEMVGNEFMTETAGWNNKMFVAAGLMPHRILITDIKVERLQDISEEDCMKEGLLAGEQEPRMYGFRLPEGTVLSFMTPREAFASLIDRISGKGTWERNPWCFAYTFKLIK